MDFLSTINYGAVLVSGIVYWIIGMLWFTVLFGKLWARLIQKHGVKIKVPSKKEMIIKCIYTFLLNLLVALGVAIFVNSLGITQVSSAITLGVVLSVCFSLATLTTGYLWESRPWKLALVDLGYPFVGIIVSSIIITLWI